MNIKQEEAPGYSKNIFMFEYHKRNFSGIDYGQYSKSPPCAINNLMWRILITKKKADDTSKDPKVKDSLGIYLECLGKSQLWSCYALVRFTLVSQKPGVIKNISLEFKHLFSAVSFSQGYHSFITWDKVTNPECGYINNDSIKVQVYVEADLPKNMSTLDYNMQQPQTFDDWLSLFENKLNDKIVRRVAEEIKTIKYEKMRNFCKLSEEINALRSTVKHMHERGLKLMSEFFTKCLKIVIASFYSKMDSLKLEAFHTEMESVLGELRRIKSGENEDKVNEKSSYENEATSNSERESEPGTAEAEAERTQENCEIIQEKNAQGTIDIRSSSAIDSDDDGNGSKNKSYVNNEVASSSIAADESTDVSTLIKMLVAACQRVGNEPDEVIANIRSELSSASRQCPPKTRPNCCELDSRFNCSCFHINIEPMSRKRKLENDTCSCSSTSSEPPEKMKNLEKDTAEDASNDDSDDASSSSCSCSCSGSCSSQSSRSSSPADEKPQKKASK